VSCGLWHDVLVGFGELIPSSFSVKSVRAWQRGGQSGDAHGSQGYS
jgi:hypothetical protein